ncbi:hypothetical protein Fot_27452 [Forsythia ovata]|uniref:Uncharacterized protein n=1 Tax=Forsythia ovata TaxID=205694 RepID=A0ABD1TL71_9LAMI
MSISGAAGRFKSKSGGGGAPIVVSGAGVAALGSDRAALLAAANYAVMVARHVAFQSMCGGTVLGSSHDDFLGAANHTFLVLPHVATQSLTGGKNLVAGETLVNPTARVRQSFKVAGFVATQSLASGKRPATLVTSVR